MSKFSMLLLISLLTGINWSFSQQTDPSQLKNKEYGKYFIENLKQGALVVRLNFKTKAINALIQAGNTNAANQIRYQQAEKNAAIMKAFKKYFEFCPVYFIAFDSTVAFVNGKRSGIYLNENLQVDPSIQPKTSFFLIAEEGTLETKVAENKAIPEQETTQHGLMDNALVIRDTDLELLHDPFPYYAHSLGNINSRVKKLDKKLGQFYEMNR